MNLDSDLMPSRTGHGPLPSLAETQARLDERAAAVTLTADLPYTLADRLEDQAERYGDRPFLYYQAQCYRYSDMNAWANQVANAMASRGIRAGDVCALAMENRPAFYAAWFGLVKLGAVVAFINTQIRGVPLVHALSTTGAAHAIVGEECLENFQATEELPSLPLWLVEDDELAARPPRELPWQPLGEAIAAAEVTPPPAGLRDGIRTGDRTLLIFTSGTTGLPKAAIYSHLRWLTSGDVMVPTVGATKEDVFYCCLPLYHGAAATSVTSTALKAGAAIVLRRKFSVSAFWSDIERHGVTVCQYIGEICRYLLNHDSQPSRHSLRCMLGAGLSAEIWQRWVERFGEMRILEGWGSTEANTSLINVDNRVGSCGRVPDWNRTNFRLVRFDVDTERHLRDEEGFCILCEPGEVGEGLGMIQYDENTPVAPFEGYTSAEATEQKILRNVFRHGDAFWRSGDLLRYDEDRYFYFVDRIGDTFRWKSENVSTQEVANALDDLPGMESLNIYGVTVPGFEGRAGMAAIVMQQGQAFDPEAFYALTAKRLPGYAAPQFVRVSASADMTSTFKLRKVDLQRQGYCPELCGEPIYLRDDAEGRYVPWSEARLEKLGLPAFRP
ncbi:MAG TPA: long-chain-acyl-CoA synthetase [Pseudomonas sp.]|nr:long-chain-acyl-CoA synthetase [Pseudomonas sp.]